MLGKQRNPESPLARGGFLLADVYRVDIIVLLVSSSKPLADVCGAAVIG